MDGIGFLSLGASAGLLTGLALQFSARASSGFGHVVAAFAPVLLSGAAVLLMPDLRGATSVGLYPFGLLIALVWRHTGAMVASALPDKFAWLPAIACVVMAIGLTAVSLYSAFNP